MIVPEQQRSQAFQKGAAARRAGKAIWTNPYDNHRNHDAEQWWLGWRSVEEGSEGSTDNSFSVLTSSAAGKIGRANGTFNPAIAVDVEEREAQRRRAKVTAGDVVVMRKMRAAGASMAEIQERFPAIGIQGVSHIVNRHGWKHVPDATLDEPQEAAS